MTKKQLLSALTGIVFLLYPALVYYGLQHYGPRLIAGSLLVLATIRLLIPQQQAISSHWLVVAAGAATVITFFSGDSFGLKLYPILVNACMLGVFCLSLYQPPTIIERLARLQEPNLPATGIRYTRRVTQLWCLFFLGNGAISTATLFASDEIWALYNGLIAYIAMATLLGAEFIFRQFYLKKNYDS